MKITYPETGIHEHERKAIDKIKQVFDKAPKTKHWRAYAGFEFMHTAGKKVRGVRDVQKFEYDLLVITHANILVIEFKDWNGKKVTKSGGKWYLDNQEKDACPVEKNKNKMFLIRNKLEEMVNQKRKQGIKFHNQSVEHFVVMCGKADYLSLPAEDLEHIMSLDEFIKLAQPQAFNDKFRVHLERNGRIWEIKKEYHQIIDEIFAPDQIQPRSLIINNHERGELILRHPKNIYTEYKAHSLNIIGEKSLMRCWDFNALQTTSTKMNQPLYRFDFICNERKIFQRIKTEKPDLYQSCLHPITNPALDDMTSKYNELYEWPDNSHRINEFIGSFATKMNDSEKFNLFQILISKFNHLHQMGIVHGDIGDHSVWISYKKEVLLSNFSVACDQTSSSSIDKELAEVLPFLTSTYRPNIKLTVFQQDIYWMGQLMAHIWKNKRLSPKSLKEFHIDQLNPDHWLERILIRSLTGQYESTDELFQEFLIEKPVEEVSYELEEAVLDPFLNQTNMYISYPMSGVPLEVKAEFTVYSSNNFLVKTWMGKIPASMTTYQRSSYKRFFEDLKAIQSLNPKFLPKIIDFGLSTITASVYLVTASVQGDPWKMVISNLSDQEKSELSLQLLRSLKHLHEHEYHHGHLDDENIFVDRTNLNVVFTDFYHPETIHRDPNSNYYPSDIENPTAKQSDNYTVLKLIADLYEVPLSIEQSTLQNQSLNWLYEALKTELLEDEGVRYIDNARFIEAFECKGAVTKEAPQITIFTGKVDSPFTIYPENGQIYIQFERAREGDIRLTFSGINGTLKGFYKPHEKELSFIDFAQQQELWWKASKDADCSIDACIQIHPISGMRKRDNIIELDSFLKQDQNFFETLTRYNQLYQDQIAAKNEVARIQGEVEEIQETRPFTQRNNDLTKTATENNIQPQYLQSFDIETKELWKKVMVTERHAHPQITLSEPLKVVDNKYLKNSTSAIAYYDSEEDVSAKFSKTDKVDVMCTKETGKGGDYTFCIGTMNIAQSKIGELWIDFCKKINEVPLEATLFLQSKADKSSNRKRADALKNILENNARINNLVDFFEPTFELNAIDYGIDVSDADFEKYDVYNENGELVKSLNPLQRKAFRKLVKYGPVSMLKGPPGTGKTEFISTLSHFLYDKLKVNNILIVSQSHEAVNTSVERIRKQCLKHGTELSIARISNKESAVSNELKDVYTGSIITSQKELFKSNLRERVIALSHELALDTEYLNDLYTIRVEILNNLRSVYRSIDQDDIDQKTNFSFDEYTQAFTSAINKLKAKFYDIQDFIKHLEACINEKDLSVLNQLNKIDNITFIALNQYYGVAYEEGLKAKALINIALDYEPLIENQNANYEGFLVKTRQLICGTCVGVGQQSIGIANQVFDWVIIDEAARSIPSELAIAMQSGTRILLVGDQNQLPPLYSSEHKKALAKQLGISKDDVEIKLQSDFGRIFDSHYGHQASAELLTQYRMSPSIGDLVSACFYENKLETAVIDSRVEPVEGIRLKRIVPDIYQSNIATELNSTVTWVDTGNAEHFTIEKGNSIYNPHEIEQIIDFLKRIDQDKELLQRLMPAPNSVKEPAIGVICTYAEQKNRLRKAFALNDVSDELRSIVRIDTVDSYQGKENQIIVLSVTRNDPTMFPAFLQSPNRVNVALSRAMDRLVIFGAEEMWQGINKDMPLGRVLTYIKDRTELISEYQCINKRAKHKKVQANSSSHKRSRKKASAEGM
ncbi:AAA domain-containing protein [Acinetobacter pittii]|uniref:AAA domain-containing protein n=1 Tax=Acinetobacter pittii TaxID=48296 RepID=UPI003B9DE559